MGGREDVDGFLELAIANINLAARSFHDTAIKIAKVTNGKLLFNVRVESDPSFQRIAAISYENSPTCIIVLLRDGTTSRWCRVDTSFDIFLLPLEHWASLPLTDQAQSKYQAYSSLLAAALRNKQLVKCED